MLSNFFIIIHLEGSLNKHFMVCPYIVSRDHKKLVKPHELQIIYILITFQQELGNMPKYLKGMGCKVCSLLKGLVYPVTLKPLFCTSHIKRCLCVINWALKLHFQTFLKVANSQEFLYLLGILSLKWLKSEKFCFLQGCSVFMLLLFLQSTKCPKNDFRGTWDKYATVHGSRSR